MRTRQLQGERAKPTTLTLNEQYSYMSMWSLMAAPLIFSGDMNQLDAFTLNVLCNTEVIDVDQDPLGKQAHFLRKTTREFVLVRELADGFRAVGLFNLENKPRKMAVTWADLKVAGVPKVRDVWRQKEVDTTADGYETLVPRHGVAFVGIIPARYRPDTRKDSGPAPCAGARCVCMAESCVGTSRAMQPPEEDLGLKERVRRLPHPTRRVPDEGRRRTRHLFRQGEGFEKPRVLVLPYRRPSTTPERWPRWFRSSVISKSTRCAMRPRRCCSKARLIKDRRPKYNVLFRDDKQFLRVRVDGIGSPIPRFRPVRDRLPDAALYYGPFPFAPEVRRVLHEMKKRFGVIAGDARPVKLDDGRWKLFDDARAEISGHPNEVTEDEYRTRVESACEWLDGKVKDGVTALKAEMKKAAAAHDYERAAYLRDTVAAIEVVAEKTRRFDRGDALPERGDKDAVKALQLALGLDEPPRTMECFDISHISGTFCVAAMPYFRDGKPDKAEYRKFRIQSFTGNDDFRAMAEVVGRRYRRLMEEGNEFPRLLVIDGGLGQVRAARESIEALGATTPPMIGLAKRDEHIIFPDGRPPLVLPKT